MVVMRPGLHAGKGKLFLDDRSRSRMVITTLVLWPVPIAFGRNAL